MDITFGFLVLASFGVGNKFLGSVVLKVPQIVGGASNRVKTSENKKDNSNGNSKNEVDPVTHIQERLCLSARKTRYNVCRVQWEGWWLLKALGVDIFCPKHHAAHMTGLEVTRRWHLSGHLDGLGVDCCWLPHPLSPSCSTPPSLSSHLPPHTKLSSHTTSQNYIKVPLYHSPQQFHFST